MVVASEEGKRFNPTEDPITVVCNVTRLISLWFLSPKYVPTSGYSAMPTPSITTANSIRLMTTARVTRYDSP